MRSLRFFLVRGRWKVYTRRHIVSWSRIVAEGMTGRPLARNEFVHHVNGIPTDDRPENLLVLTPSEHSKLHAGRRKEVHLEFIGDMDRFSCRPVRKVDLDFGLLTHRQKLVVRSRLEGWTAEEIAHSLCVTAARIRQIYSGALPKIRVEDE